MPSIEKSTPYRKYEDTSVDLETLKNLAMKISKRSLNLKNYKKKRFLRSDGGIMSYCGQIQAVAAELDKLFIEAFGKGVVNSPSNVAKKGQK